MIDVSVITSKQDAAFCIAFMDQMKSLPRTSPPLVSVTLKWFPYLSECLRLQVYSPGGMQLMFRSLSVVELR